jgi:hypothetical protein
MGDLQQVPASAIVRHGVEQVAVAVVLEIPREQDALAAQADREHDRGVVDGPAIGQESVGDRRFRGPEHVHAGLPQRERVSLGHTTSRDAEAHRRRTQLEHPRTPRPHAGLDDAADTVARRQPSQASGVVFVWVCQQSQVDVPVPGRDALVEPADEQVGVGATIDEQARAVAGLHQDGVPLAHVEHTHLQARARSSHERDRGRRHEPDGDERGGKASRPARGHGHRRWLPRSQPTRVLTTGPVDGQQEAREGRPGAKEVGWRKQLHVGQWYLREQTRTARHQGQRDPGARQQWRQQQRRERSPEEWAHHGRHGGTEHGQRHDGCHKQVRQW